MFLVTLRALISKLFIAFRFINSLPTCSRFVMLLPLASMINCYPGFIHAGEHRQVKQHLLGSPLLVSHTCDAARHGFPSRKALHLADTQIRSRMSTSEPLPLPSQECSSISSSFRRNTRVCVFLCKSTMLSLVFL